MTAGWAQDKLLGGAGSDTYKVDNAADKVTENVGEGTEDTVHTTLATYTLGLNLRT